MRLSFVSPWQVLGILFIALALPDLVEAGSIGWADMADDASSSMMSLASSAIPLVIGAGAMSYCWHLTSMTGGLLSTAGATYVAANADQPQGIIGGGGAGGLITDIVTPVSHTLQLLI